MGLLAPRSEIRYFDNGNNQNSKSTRVRPPANIDEWQDWFRTYSIIFTSRYPYAAPELFGYQKRIYSLYLKNKNTFIWRLYDEEFRKYKACRWPEDFEWQKLNQGILNDVEDIQARSDNRRNRFNNQNKTKSSVKWPKNGTCHAWNGKGCKGGNNCKWTHACVWCKSKDHKAAQCDSKK